MLAEKINQLLLFEIFTPESRKDLEIFFVYQNRIKGWRRKVINWALSKPEK